MDSGECHNEGEVEQEAIEMKYRGILSITSFVEDLPLKRKSKHQWQ
jgi:hypothetical protein